MPGRRIVDAIRSTLDEREQARLLKEGTEIIVTDLPAIPLYRDIDAPSRISTSVGGTSPSRTT